MTVIYSGDIDLLRDNLQAMFHGAKLDDRTGWKPRNITQRILALLDGLSDDVVEMTADEVAAGLDAGPWKGISKLVPTDGDLSYVGWEFIKGKRGNGSRPAVFRRLRPDVCLHGRLIPRALRTPNVA